MGDWSSIYSPGAIIVIIVSWINILGFFKYDTYLLNYLKNVHHFILKGTYIFGDGVLRIMRGALIFHQNKIFERATIFHF